MLARFRRFLRYPAAERRALTRALGLLAMARAVLRLSGVPTARRVAGGAASAVDVPPARLVELITVAAHQLPGATTCLPRAIVTEALLRANGRRAELKIGVASIPAAGPPDTHAWVELDGVSLDDASKAYQALPLFGTEG